MPRNLKKRLAHVERTLREVANREQSGDCNCLKVTFFRVAEQFAEESNRPCPRHGFRDLGCVGLTIVRPTNGQAPEDNSTLRKLIADYETARARHQANIELEDDDSQEL